ncbi:MAG TPA: hydrogenase, partial [Candidatus Omnitrophota bacterium]|nr:hydrogenase [Candidatus Omnitrophota bacterium]
IICVLAVFLSLAIISTRRIVGMIQIFSLQSLLIGLLPLLINSGMPSAREILVAAGTILVKAALVPAVLFWAIRHVSMRSEIKPLIGFGTSVIIGAILIAGAFRMSLSLKIPWVAQYDLLVPCSLATMILGFMLLVTRTRAITQVVGYLVMENGIFLFALLLFDVMPLLVEMGILLDIFVAVFIMAIIVNHINEEFEHAPATFNREKMGESI